MVSSIFKIVKASTPLKSGTVSPSATRDCRATDSVSLSSGIPDERFEKPSAIARVYCPSVTALGKIPSERSRPKSFASSTRLSLAARPQAIIRLQPVKNQCGKCHKILRRETSERTLRHSLLRIRGNALIEKKVRRNSPSVSSLVRYDPLAASQYSHGTQGSKQISCLKFRR